MAFFIRNPQAVLLLAACWTPKPDRLLGKPAVKMASALVLSGVLCAWSIAAGVQLKYDGATPVTEGYAAAIGEPQARARIISSFSVFAGSEANALSLVAGLRQGREITLTVPANGGQPGAATRFTPPTRPMDYGNVRISLALAREQLAQLGIARPTPSQIKAVLAGGGVAIRVSGRATTPFLFPGVLQLRAGGMGWAKIADSMGVKLGLAVSGNAHPAAFTTPPISSASITTTAAAGAGNVAVARQSAPARRSARGGPEPEIRRSRTSIIAAADSAVKGAGVTMPVQYGVNSTVVMTEAATEAPGAAVEPVRLEDGQAAE